LAFSLEEIRSKTLDKQKNHVNNFICHLNSSSVTKFAEGIYEEMRENDLKDSGVSETCESLVKLEVEKKTPGNTVEYCVIDEYANRRENIVMTNPNIPRYHLPQEIQAKSRKQNVLNPTRPTEIVKEKNESLVKMDDAKKIPENNLKYRMKEEAMKSRVTIGMANPTNQTTTHYILPQEIQAKSRNQMSSIQPDLQMLTEVPMATKLQFQPYKIRPTALFTWRIATGIGMLPDPCIFTWRIATGIGILPDPCIFTWRIATGIEMLPDPCIFTWSIATGIGMLPDPCMMQTEVKKDLLKDTCCCIC